MVKAVLPRNASRLALLALLAWAVFACALELHRSEWLLRHDPFPEEQPSRWRITGRPVARLANFLAAVRTAVPAGSRIAVTTEPGPPRERFFRSLWVAYFLPGVEILPENGSAAGPPADFVLAYGTRVADPELVPVLSMPDGSDGVLYRVRRSRRSQ